MNEQLHLAEQNVQGNNLIGITVLLVTLAIPVKRVHLA